MKAPADDLCAAPTGPLAGEGERAHAATVQTPDGLFTVVASDLSAPDGAVLASGWSAGPLDLLPLIHPSLRPEPHEVLLVEPSHPALAPAFAAVERYYAGDLTATRHVPVRQVSGEFRMHAWETLREVAPGRPLTYTEYAEASGRPSAVRAAAAACSQNAAALFVPCHRVVRTDGSLGGFRYGLGVKRSLLARESGD